jgi:hypothetical protein
MLTLLDQFTRSRQAVLGEPIASRELNLRLSQNFASPAGEIT